MMFGSGDTIVVHDDLYGGTYRLFETVFATKQIRAHYVDLRNFSKLSSALASAPKAVWVESPTNPLMNLVDIRAVAEFATNTARSSFVTIHFFPPTFSGRSNWARHRRAFDDQIHQWSFGRGGRGCCGKRLAPRRTDLLFAECPGDLRGTTGLFPCAPWHQNPRPAYGRAQPQRVGNCALGSSSIPRCQGCSIRDWKAIRNTNWLCVRQGDLEERFPSDCLAERTPSSNSWQAVEFSPLRSRWGESSRSSSILPQ